MHSKLVVVQVAHQEQGLGTGAVPWRRFCGGRVVAASGKSESPLYPPQSIPQGGAGDSPTHFASESPGCTHRCLSNRCSGDTDLLEGAIGTHRRMHRRSPAEAPQDAPQRAPKTHRRSTVGHTAGHTEDAITALVAL